MRAPFLYVVVCGAGPAPYVGRLVGLARDRGWDAGAIATPAARGFLDVPALERQTGHSVRSEYRAAGEGRERSLPLAGAIVVAPATYNTINKWALGISDTYALGVLAEASSSLRRPARAHRRVSRGISRWTPRGGWRRARLRAPR